MELTGLKARPSFGLNGLDHALADQLRLRGGFFVEAGANDGVSQSNTLYLERYYNWRGLLIEPVPEIARRCRSNRPRAIVEQCALVAEGFPDATVEMRYCNLMSLVGGARGTEDADEAHIAAGRQFLRPDEEPYAITVPARTLTSVLSAHGVGRIDLLSLDVEGYEPQVLRGLDFERYAPRYILVEANDPGDVERSLDGRYDLMTQLTGRDRLYRLGRGLDT